MPTLTKKPTEIKAHGNIPKIIREYIGRVNSSTKDLSLAHMLSSSGWEEAAQKPQFDEYTLVLKGVLRVATKDKTFDVKVGQAIIAHKGEWVKYSSPAKEPIEPHRTHEGVVIDVLLELVLDPIPSDMRSRLVRPRAGDIRIVAPIVEDHEVWPGSGLQLQ